MKKLSERAIEIYREWFKIPEFFLIPLCNVRTDDLAKALDEYQEQVKMRLDRLEKDTKKATEQANEALRVARLGPDPRLCGGWSDGRT